MVQSRTYDDVVINSPFEEPSLHFKFDVRGVARELLTGRRISCYVPPVPATEKGGYMADLIEEPNKIVNQIRTNVQAWRKAKYAGATSASKRLLLHWKSDEREKRIFFCQLEAVETAIYLAEVAPRLHKRQDLSGDKYVLGKLKEFAKVFNQGIARQAFKIATGGGKTAVMAMLIVWQTVNAYIQSRSGIPPRKRKFSDCFLVITPGITIRDNLAKLIPGSKDNIYDAMKLLPNKVHPDILGSANVSVANYHAFMCRTKMDVPSAAASLSGLKETDAHIETPEEAADRVCRPFNSSMNIVILNDEAHHCYLPKDAASSPSGEEAENARVWFSGLETVHRLRGVRQTYDLSATPFFIAGSGYGEERLFPWVVSDFPLTDAIESGIVKVPSVPVKQTGGQGINPVFRELWPHVKKSLSNPSPPGEPPEIPRLLEDALHTLYRNYEEAHDEWEMLRMDEDSGTDETMPPVFIIVCSNTKVADLMYRHIGGWERATEVGNVLVPGDSKYRIFNNVNENGSWKDLPPTFLIDSLKLESDKPLSAEFKRAAAKQIDAFKKSEAREKNAQAAADIDDKDLLREVINSVGKKGRLGEHVKCVISVAMLSEGWDAKTVMHILGLRAFSTQLLCEQVVGRALRRTEYKNLRVRVLDTGDGIQRKISTFEMERANIFGVPFSYFACGGDLPRLGKLKAKTRVRALPERRNCEIRFPRVMGYTQDLPPPWIRAKFTKACRITPDLSSPHAVVTENIGGRRVTTDVDVPRAQTSAYELALKVLHRTPFIMDKCADAWRFPNVLDIVNRWISFCLGDKVIDDRAVSALCSNNVAPKMVALAIRKAAILQGKPIELPVQYPDGVDGTTSRVDFETTRPVFPTAADKCHVSHVVADTQVWEQEAALRIEAAHQTLRYVKNDRDHVGLCIIYWMHREWHRYYPDFIVHIRPAGNAAKAVPMHFDGVRSESRVNLILEISGHPIPDAEKRFKVAGAKRWVAAVNAAGKHGLWAFRETTDPTTVEALIDEVAADPMLDG